MGKLKESGSGGSKKDAKREAAQKMIDKLKDLGPNSSEQVPTRHLTLKAVSRIRFIFNFRIRHNGTDPEPAL